MTAYATAPVPSSYTAAREVGFLRGPFAGATFREIGYTITSLPVAIVGFVFTVVLFSAGVGLAVTVLGLPVLAAMLAGARGLGAAERGRARLGLGLDVEGPGPVVAERSGFWGAMRARLTDAAGWKALLFHVVMFPYRIFSFVMSVTFLLVGWVVALLPAYNWVFPKYVEGWGGYRIYDFTSGGIRHTYDITSPLQLAAVSLVGFAVVFLTPKLVRALTNVDRAAVRGLLGK
ncbi:hypothetical protein GCM10010329_22520 [Streptomyces spiroverticillatus]|uniref:Putative sensor domain-containing protein n=1 Tax=Streptomyces finlayi TaxID=67296 RepID=A0A918WUL5_9ACTN|nr:sensor domain-containing protein [Streptomyces finlayi]GHA00253.1 hypothetical protein GCM10010329_22520 [Streptomyces spiroverticillatus]GHC84739.1 hypothetical protein GCM10010334_14950 [Streptomyces finlayi]